MASLLDHIDVSLVLYWGSTYVGIMTVQVQDSIIESYCPTTTAQKVRCDTWKLTLKGEEVRGVTIPHPAHQFAYQSGQRELRRFYVDYNINQSETIVFSTDTQVPLELLTVRGPFPAYVGSRTQEKITGKMYQLPVSGRPLESAQRLLQLDDWVISPRSKLHEYLVSLASSRTNLDPELIRLVTPRVAGGSAVHRLNDHATKRGTAHSFRPNITTHIYYSTDSLGKFSRGHENYNMHYQGAVHLGFFIYTHLSGVFGEKIPPTIILRYQGTCCEEILPDVILENDNPPPKITTYHHNPLIYLYIENAPPSVIHQSHSVIQYVSSDEPSSAIASILFSRCLSVTHAYVLGSTDSSNPTVSSLSVADVQNVGLKLILEQLAVNLYLYLPADAKLGLSVLDGISAKIFEDLASFCLLDGLYVELCELCNTHALPDAFTNPLIVCNMIKVHIQYLVGSFFRNSKLFLRHLPKHVFYPSVKLGIWRIIRMWAKLLIVLTGGGVNIFPLLHYIKIPDHLISNYLEPKDFSEFILRIVDTYGAQTLELITITCPLKLSTIPAELIMRRSRTPVYKMLHPPSYRKAAGHTNPLSKRRVINPLRSQPITPPRGNDNYQQWLLLPPRSSRLMVDTEYFAPIPRESKHKTRSDHAFRTLGPVSTTFYKIQQILDIEEIRLSGACVTIAEGEGSIAQLLILSGATEIYYNSLINKKKLIPQRATSYVPAACVEFKDKIRLAPLSALEGGDLTDPRFLKLFLSMLPSSSEMTTCDAECATDFTPKMAARITLSWVMSCLRSKSRWGVMKTFCHNPHLMIRVSGAAQTIYKWVKVVVPLFSTHEGYECYVIATDLDPMLTLDQLFEHYEQWAFVYPENATSLLETFIEYAGTRLKDRPHQLDNIALTRHLQNQLKGLGFKWNLRSCLSRLVLFIKPYVEDLPLEMWLRECSQFAWNRAVELIEQTARSYYGLATSSSETLHMISRGHSTHGGVESHLLIVYNCTVLRKILPVSDLQIAEKVLDKICLNPVRLMERGVLLYTFLPEQGSWRTDYGKTIWRIWGNQHSKDLLSIVL